MANRIRTFLAFLILSSVAFGQGVSFQTPPIMSQVPQPIAGLNGAVCLATSTGTPCTPTVSVFSDSALSVPITSLKTDGDGLFPTFFISPGQYQWCASDTLGRISAYCTKFTAPAAAGSSPSFVNLTVTNTATINTAVAGQINKSIWVDGTKYPVTQAGIQQAFTDACAITGGPGPGTDVYLPPMSVGLFNVSGQQFLVTCNLHIHGAGDQATQFVVAGGVANTVPEFRFKPDHVSAQSDILVEGIQILGSTSGGDAFFFDGTGAGITGPNNFVLRKNFVTGLASGSKAVNISGTGSTQDGWNLIENNTFNSGGVTLNSNATDSWLIAHNIFNSTNGTACVDGTSSNGGASHITVFNNSGGCDGGFFISHGTVECKILYNQIEQATASVEANSAMIDLLGDTFSIDRCDIIGNNMGSLNNAAINIRVNAATRTYIAGNAIGIKATTGTGIVLTASSSGTIIDSLTNEFIGVGGGAVAMTNASGANPFCHTFPTSTGTLAATECNDTAGGFLWTTNGGFSWSIGNSGTLNSPAGAGLGLNGASSGEAQIIGASVAGGTHTVANRTETYTGTVASIDLTAQTAAQGTTTLFAVPSTGAGQYLFSWNAKITTAAGVSSTLGPMTLIYTDPDGVTITTVVSATSAGGGLGVGGLTTNTTSTFLIGTPLLINAKASTNIQVSFGYASNAAAAMNYNLHEKLVAF